MLLLQAFDEDSVPADAAHTEPVLRILLSFPGRSCPRSTELTPDLCSRYALEALKWLRKQPQASAGPQQPSQQAPDSRRVQAACEQIHLHLAVLITTYYGPPGLGWAGPHFARSHDPAAFAHAVAAAAGADSGPGEHLYITRAALQVGHLAYLRVWLVSVSACEQPGLNSRLEEFCMQPPPPWALGRSSLSMMHADEHSWAR